MKSQKMIDRGYRYKYKSSQTNLESLQCQSELEQFRSDFYAEMETELKSDEDLSENLECLIEQFKKFHLAEVSMKKIIYQNPKVMSKRKRKKALRAIESALEKKIETGVKLCTFEKTFGDLFDELYASANETDSREEGVDKVQEDYCMRKHIVDKGFINTTAYNVNLNPENIDVTELCCDEIIEEAIKEAVEELMGEFEDEGKRLSKRTLKCIAKTIRTQDFFETNVKLIVLGELGISEEAKDEERSHYVESIKQLYENIMKC